MPDRNRIASQKIDGSTNTFSIYGPAGEDGRQPITDNVTVDTGKFPLAQQAMLAAVGFGRVCEGRWNRKDAGEVGPIIAAVTNEMQSGTWSPGRVFEEREPSDLVLALAEVKKVPAHLIQTELDERMKYVDPQGNYVRSAPDPSKGHVLYKDSKGRTHKFYDKACQDELAKLPAVATVLARLIRERAAKMTAAAKVAPRDGAMDLDDLFPTGEESTAAAAAA